MEELFEIKAAQAAEDYIDEEGYLCCGNCNTRKQYRIPWPSLMGKVPWVNVSFRFFASAGRRKMREWKQRRKQGNIVSL